MNPEIVMLVRQSWARMLPDAPQVAALFCCNLMILDPPLKDSFGSDMEAQAQKLVQIIDAVVARIDALDMLVPMLQNLGERQTAHGIGDEHYLAGGVALLMTLAQGLGDEFTLPVREAWTNVYSLVVTLLIDAGGAGA